MKYEFNILSPDGIEIRNENFESYAQAWQFFEKWKKSFEIQGYYSSCKGKIHLEDLRNFCTPVKRPIN